MYDKKKIISIVDRVCTKYERRNLFHFNGERAEGISFVATDMVDSWWIYRIIEAINEAYPDHRQLGGFRIQNGKHQVPCPGVSKAKEDDCVEIRLEYSDYGDHYVKF